jgi:putative addiction module component (TIGR02574 family)
LGKNMPETIYDDIFGTALALPPGLRVMLAEQLLKSLDSAQQIELENIWSDEAEKRIQSIEQGLVQPIPSEQVMRDLRARNK